MFMEHEDEPEEAGPSDVLASGGWGYADARRELYQSMRIIMGSEPEGREASLRSKKRKADGGERAGGGGDSMDQYGQLLMVAQLFAGARRLWVSWQLSCA